MRKGEASASMPYWTRQHALLEQLALGPVGRLGGVGGDRARLLGEGQVGVARSVGRLHGRIARQGSRNAEFLLLPVHIGDGVARRRFDQPAQPDAGAKYKSSIARLIAPRARSER